MAEQPKCECGCTSGLDFRDGRWWGFDCVWGIVISSSEPTELPCAKCGGLVMEFTIPNDIWNLVVRRGGPERGEEYLCYPCFITAVGAEVKRLRPVIAELREQRPRLEQIIEDYLPGLTETRLAEDLFDALVIYEAANTEGGGESC